MDRIVADRAARLSTRLEDLRRSYDEALVARRQKGRARGDEHVVFQVAGSTLAIRSGELLETVPTAGVVSVPAAPPEIAGAMSYRQEILQLIDLHRFLDIPVDRSEPPDWTLVLRPLALRTGLLADGLVGLHRIDPAAIAARSEPWSRGQVVVEGRPVCLLEPESLVPTRTPEGAEEKP